MDDFHDRAFPAALAAAAVFFAAPALAWSPFALSLYIDNWDARITDLQVPSHETSVYGLRIGFAGAHERMDGVAVGLVNFDSAVGGEASGFAVSALANAAEETDMGILQASVLFNSVRNGGALAQFAAGGNFAGCDAAGVQVSIGANVVSGSFSGFQASYFLNWASGDVSGVQFFGGGNFAGGDFSGFQLLGTWNEAENVEGGQLGLINLAADLDGFQIGAFNDSDDAAGLQLGAVNLSDGFDGFQLGALNRVANSPANCHEKRRYDTILQIGVLNFCGVWGVSTETIVQIGVLNGYHGYDWRDTAPGTIVQIGLLNFSDNINFPVLPILRLRITHF